MEFNLDTFIASATLLFVLLNPFMMSVYLNDLVDRLDYEVFKGIVIRAGFIATSVFIVFALVGDAFFSHVLQARFAALLLFGGLVFLLIGLKMILVGSESLSFLRGDPEYLSSTVAMPFMVGPGTLSASIVAGSRLSPLFAVLAVVIAMLFAVLSLLAFKWIIDTVRKKREKLVRRYFDIAGRLAALVIGTLAVEMIIQGVEVVVAQYL